MKTLGQLLFQKVWTGPGSGEAWLESKENHRFWEAAAQAVRAATLEEVLEALGGRCQMQYAIEVIESLK